MAPVDNAKSNSLPVALFGGHMLLVAALTANILVQTRRAAQSLPPSTRTRAQNARRRRNAVVFSLIAAASLASVGSFAFLWRAISYVRWAEAKHYATPNSIWSGWHTTGSHARWRLGDWVSDIDLVREFDEVGIRKPSGFLYTSQYFVGLLASAIFMGAEGRRRDLAPSLIASFVLLCSLGSLGFALSLFFVTILYTPTSVGRDESPRHDAFFTPSPMVYDVGIIVSLLTLNSFPELMAEYGDKSMLRLSYLAMPLFFAFAPQIVPVSLGSQHTSKAAAHRSYAKVFYVLSLASLMLSWRVVVTTVFVNTPSKKTHVWDLVTHSHGKNTNRLLAGLSAAGQKLKVISTHPAISVTSLDVFFTVIALLTWTFRRDLEVGLLLESSVLSFLAPKHEQHVAFQQQVTRLMEPQPEPAVTGDAATRRRRGRPATSAAAVKGSSRRKGEREGPDARRHVQDAADDADGDATYQPPEDTRRAVAETEADGAMADGDIVHGGESTALAMFLAMVGGVGQLASAVLGAEVTGP